MLAVARAAVSDIPARPATLPVAASPDGFADLDRFATRIVAEREETLFFEGEAAEHYLRVVRGVARSCRLLPDGRRHIGEFFLPGDVIGLATAGLGAQTYPFSAEAVSDLVVLRYPRRVFDRLMGEPNDFGRSLLALALSGLAAAQEQLLLLGRKTATERVASFILAMAQRTLARDRVPLPMTRTDIADHLGLTTETVSRTLSQLRSEGVIQLLGLAEVRLLQPDRLRRLAGRR